MKTTILLGRGIKMVLLLILLFVGNALPMSAQEDFICATEDDFDSDPPTVYSGSTDQAVLDAMDPVVLNVYYWRLDNQFGTVHPNALTQERALDGIAHLNIIYNPVGIFFKYRGMGSFSSPPDLIHKIYSHESGECEVILDANGNPEIDPDGFETISRCQLSDLTSYISNSNGDYEEPNSMNIYVPRGTTDFGGAALGFARAVFTVNGIDAPLAVHELGHVLGLRHTHQGWHSTNPDYENCEHVTRDPNDPEGNFNADTRGDEVVDTAAMPEFRREYCTLNGLPASECGGGQPYYFFYYDTDNCEYEGEFREDCIGYTYQIDATNARNYMSYAPNYCMDNFSIGQGIKMKERINDSQILQARTAPISSLYEPYQGEYYLAGPALPESSKPLFQPGFDYSFIECSCSTNDNSNCSQPTAYDDTSFQNLHTVISSYDKLYTLYEDITHPNHTAVMIDQLETNQTRRCYDNFNKAPIGGSITKFNDGVFNTNVTITTQDSTAINNPTLVNDLPQGLYKLEKNYDDGAVQETVIIKENN